MLQIYSKDIIWYQLLFQYIPKGKNILLSAKEVADKTHFECMVINE